MKMISKVMFGFASIALIAMAAGLILHGCWQVASALLNGAPVADPLLSAVGYIVIAIAVFDVAKFLVEEEVLSAAERSVASEARKDGRDELRQARSFTTFLKIDWRSYGKSQSMDQETPTASQGNLQIPEPSLIRQTAIPALVVHVKGTARLVAAPPDGEDVAVWETRLKEVLGTTSDHFVKASVRQLIVANKLPGQAVACTTSLSAALAFIGSLEPENEAQAALAVQLAALHSATMNVLGRIHNIGERNMITMASAGAKLERAFQSGS